MAGRVRLSDCIRYFAVEARRAYGDRTDVFAYNPAIFKQPGWSLPADAIAGRTEEIMKSPGARMPVALRYIKFHGQRLPCLPAITDWLGQYGIRKLSHYADGNTYASVFEASMEEIGAPARVILRLGIAKDSVASHRITWMRQAWSPFAIQPHVRAIMPLNEGRHVSLELSPLLSHVIDEPLAVSHLINFLNRHILVGTPYEAFENKDWALLRDATPVSSDPDCFNFKNGKLAADLAETQFDPAWQQEIMATIAENCERHEFREPLSWVVKQPDGTFATKQSVLYPNPWPHLVARTVIRLG